MLELEQPVPSQGAHHAPDGVLEHLTDRARLQVTELVPHELCAVFVVSPVEKDNVHEPQIGVILASAEVAKR
ncbi:hypothetical protein [Sorangium sp. So ce362]|uniref:hypothetical protein n=1 Tax=Sorangium sp. So ce362 TaxID=3133303 RepID=UPI003F639259